MNNNIPKNVTDKMFNNDPFSQWLGIERVEDGVGEIQLKNGRSERDVKRV